MDILSLLLSLLIGQASKPESPQAAEPAAATAPAPFIRPLWPPLGG